MKTKYFLNKYNHPQFEIIVMEISNTHVNFTVNEITSWSADGKNTSIDRQLYLTAYMKWDNCNHFTFGEKDDSDNQDGYLHICGAQSMENHLLIMEYLYSYATELMKREPEEKLDVKVKVLS